MYSYLYILSIQISKMSKTLVLNRFLNDRNKVTTVTTVIKITIIKLYNFRDEFYSEISCFKACFDILKHLMPPWKLPLEVDLRALLENHWFTGFT